MTDPNGWPDASKPGYPLNPERDGWHLVEWSVGLGRVWREVWKWRLARRPSLWLRPSFTGGPYGYEPKHLTAPIYASIRYLGPCHTPAEVAALVEAARREEREACAKVVYASATRLEESAGRRRLNQVDAHAVPVLRGIADAIRARGGA